MEWRYGNQISAVLAPPHHFPPEAKNYINTVSIAHEGSDEQFHY